MSSDRRLTHLFFFTLTFRKGLPSMSRPLRIVLLLALACTVTTWGLAQRRDPNNAARKSATIGPSILCEGDAIPRGYVIVGFNSSTRCGAKSEVVIKKPEEAEIVCNGSPIPD